MRAMTPGARAGFAAVIALLVSAPAAWAHGALEVLVARTALNQLAVDAHLDEAVHVPRSVFPNLEGYATPSIGFEDLPLDDPDHGLFVISTSAVVRVRLLSADPEVSLYDGFNQVPVGGTLTLGSASFDFHPLFNIAPTASPGQEFSVVVQFEDTSGTYLTSDPITILVTPACAADIDLSGTLSVQDIFDFLGLFFAGLPRADINGVGGVTVQDVFDFLEAYFQPCP